MECWCRLPETSSLRQTSPVSMLLCLCLSSLNISLSTNSVLEECQKNSPACFFWSSWCAWKTPTFLLPLFWEVQCKNCRQLAVIKAIIALSSWEINLPAESKLHLPDYLLTIFYLLGSIKSVLLLTMFSQVCWRVSALALPTYISVS